MPRPTTAKILQKIDYSVSLRIELPTYMFKRNPEESELGRAIISGSIILLDKIGFENFTFKKLAEHIRTTEASVYRYFSDKQVLLQYLETWYWSWLDLRLRDALEVGENDRKKKLEIALKILAESGKYDPSFSHIDESLLHHVIIKDGRKGYKNQKSDEVSAVPPPFYVFHQRLYKLIKEISPKFKFPKALALTLITTVHSSMFFGEVFPDTVEEIDEANTESLLKFLKEMTNVLLLK